MIDSMIIKYADMQAQMEALKSQMEALKTDIMSEMNALGEEKHITASGETAQIIVKETFKYEDELAMIKWLKSNGYESLVIEKIDTTPMNKELKKGMTLTESLRPLYTRNVTSSFSVKRAI